MLTVTATVMSGGTQTWPTCQIEVNNRLFRGDENNNIHIAGSRWYYIHNELEAMFTFSVGITIDYHNEKYWFSAYDSTLTRCFINETMFWTASEWDVFISRYSLNHGWKPINSKDHSSGPRYSRVCVPAFLLYLDLSFMCSLKLQRDKLKQYQKKVFHPHLYFTCSDACIQRFKLF